MTYSILLADDHTIFRDGLKALIEKQKDLKVIAQASNGRQAIQLANQLIPDLAIIDEDGAVEHVEAFLDVEQAKGLVVIIGGVEVVGFEGFFELVVIEVDLDVVGFLGVFEEFFDGGVESEFVEHGRAEFDGDGAGVVDGLIEEIVDFLEFGGVDGLGVL